MRLLVNICGLTYKDLRSAPPHDVVAGPGPEHSRLKDWGGQGEGTLRTQCKQKGLEGGPLEVEGLGSVVRVCKAQETCLLRSCSPGPLRSKGRKEGRGSQTAGDCSGVAPCLSWACGVCGLLISEAL